MQYKLINTDQYLLIVSDDEIKMDDYYLDDTNNVRVAITEAESYWTHRKNYKKVVSYLPLNNSPILKGVDLLPPLEQEEDVERLADALYVEKVEAINDSDIRGYIVSATKSGFIDGYNKAKEKYKFTERQLDAAIDWGIKQGREGDVTITDIDNYIQSLSQSRMPIGFECLDKEYRVRSGTIEEHREGKAGYEFYQWIGKYIY